MKKIRMILIAMLCGCILLAGCGAGGSEAAGAESSGAGAQKAEEAPAGDAQTGEAAEAEEDAGEEEETEVDAQNRKMIAEALGIPEDQRNIRFILANMETVGAGQIQSAEMTEADGAEVFHIVGEDGTNYHFYLSGSGKVDAVKNADTGEWLITSER